MREGDALDGDRFEQLRWVGILRELVTGEKGTGCEILLGVVLVVSLCTGVVKWSDDLVVALGVCLVCKIFKNPTVVLNRFVVGVGGRSRIGLASQTKRAEDVGDLSGHCELLVFCRETV